MAAISNVPELVDKKGGRYYAVAPRLEPEKFNKYKKRMLCYLMGMEPYYTQCIKDGPFKLKMTEGADKPKAQWTPERDWVNQDQRLKSIIISCLPNNIIETGITMRHLKIHGLTWFTALKEKEVSDENEETQVERLNLDSKLPNFNTGRILVPESKAVNDCLLLTEASSDPKKLLQALRTSDHDMYIASLRSSQNFKTQPYQCASHSKQILKSKAKPYPPCTHCVFNDHRPDDCRNYPECKICRSYDHFTSEHNRIIQIRGGVLVESSQSSGSSIRVSCTTYGSSVHSTTDHNDFKHFKRGEKLRATKAKEPTKSGCSRSMTGVKSYLHKYVEQPDPKVVFSDNSSCITEGYGQLCDAKYIVEFDDKQGTIFNANKEIMLIAPRRNDVYVLDMSSLTLSGACFFSKALESVNWLWHKRLSHLNFKSINKLAKQNKVLGLPSLVYSKDKPCSACEKENTKELPSKLNKTSQSGNACIFFIWIYLDLLVQCPLTIRNTP
ncbi:retrovirus-related pol polyprotein from transposon TNT 1-94 [Tanacetum coccineum]